jgi:uncharacterized protein YbaR (Trm112 family)
LILDFIDYINNSVWKEEFFIMNKPELPQQIQRLLCCPICKEKITIVDNQCECENKRCASVFPIIDGVPILINEQSSIFSIDDFEKHRDTTFNLSRFENNGGKNVWRNLKEYTPSIGKNYKAEENYVNFVKHLKAISDHPKVLVIGGGIEGAGLKDILLDSTIEFIETDVSFGPRTSLICDAHDIPFDAEVFDGTVVQAVLEHVADPWDCVEEIHRVTKDDGIVYAETPFMQQVHMGRYDFTRFTYLGHRRLFRRFEEIDSGPVTGPGMALAWSYRYFMLSFCQSRIWSAFARRFTAFTSFWLKYLDYFVIDKPGSYDAASGYFFIGRKKRDYILSDKELIRLYKGLQQ